MTSFTSRAHSRLLRLATTAVMGILHVAVIEPGCCTVECHGGCPDTLPVANSECGTEGPTCGPYDASLPCGVQRVTAVCGSVGLWVYETDCNPNCGAMADEATCDGTFGCLWVEPCAGSTGSTKAGCTHLASPCDACESGTTCQSVSFSPCNPKSSDCSHCGAVANFCLPVEPTCTDGLKNGAETDIDCGGGECAKCAPAKSCLVDMDCTSNKCAASKCAP